MTIRESFFSCSFTSPVGRVTEVIVAWDAKEAAQSFRAQLAESRVLAAGTIEVIGRDALPLRRRVRPAATARRRAASRQP